MQMFVIFAALKFSFIAPKEVVVYPKLTLSILGDGLGLPVLCHDLSLSLPFYSLVNPNLINDKLVMISYNVQKI